MKRFSDFASNDKLDGKKIKIDDILNKEIIIKNYTTKKSKYSKEDDDYLTLQLEMNNENYILFTGSKVLLDQIIKYKENIPFITTIKKIDRYFTFT